jgi:hypothetical protein
MGSPIVLIGLKELLAKATAMAGRVVTPSPPPARLTAKEPARPESSAMPRSSRVGWVREDLGGRGVEGEQPDEEGRENHGKDDAGEQLDDGLERKIEVAGRRAQGRSP